ncbi:glycosyltransferase family 2 protein [Paenibacillus alginolyticus]|uniref:Glycosyltransferase family 2 protein n=1 Tax=Paenibacillus alginolyticus TaxID=59839 RepID=A0ABT4GE19_9BACL|nr:glycosyltransferase family A protein [Paenibacillus alginolyticus]MCY9694359.1 glycosyltransferase family 2 protein [Paenibacillus alginolyticus]MEC0147528.1 glycosyltransferase family A protein [Paenibacillus alginolyticus]
MKLRIKKPKPRPLPVVVKKKRIRLKKSVLRSAPKHTPSLTRTQLYWKNWGKRAGRQDALAHDITKEGYQKKALNNLWVHHANSQLLATNVQSYVAASRGYVKGYCKAAKLPAPDWILIPTARSVGAIVSVMNEERTIVKVLEQLNRLPLDEIIIIVNGSSDRTLEKVRAHSHALIVHYPDPLGHDVGRSIGAKLSNSDILLFLDGDFVVQAEKLIPFIYDVERGSDLALNNITPYLPPFSHWDSVTVMKRFLNVTLKRPELNANSLTAVPHALSRNALEHIGYSELMVPPKAQVNAILTGLRITAPTSVNVVSVNKVRSHNKGKNNPVARLIIGDHVEALQFAMKLKGERIVYPDIIRKREFLER